MKIWTQSELDERIHRGRSGPIDLGTGVYSAVDFAGASSLIIGEGSVLGAGVRLGDMVRIGRYTTVGEDCRLNGLATIGERCRFGEGAHIGPCSKIGNRVRFDAGCDIGVGSELGDMIVLPDVCRLYGHEVYGGSLIKIQDEMLRVYAMRGTDGLIWICRTGNTSTLEEWLEMAEALASSQEERYRSQGEIMTQMALYVQARMRRWDGISTI